MDDEGVDKQWASRYILGPLYDPEPSQVSATRVKVLPPTPPSSTSPTRAYFGSPRSNSKRHKAPAATAANDNDDDDDDDDDAEEQQPILRRLLSISRSNSARNRHLPPSPPQQNYHSSVTGLQRSVSVHTANPPQTRWNQGTILARSNSVASPRPRVSAMSVSAGQERATGRHRSGSLAERYPGDRSHRPLEMLMQEHYAKDDSKDAREHRPKPEPSSLPSRGGSLRERYPGDMSHRPLAMIKREHRAADRAPYLHTHRRQQPSDPIDLLDHTGPLPQAAYHHGGPFDPLMTSRNTNKTYSPVEAVKETNMEAIRATPAEYLQDSLVKHMPLQGTAVIPPGMQTMSGHTMEYEEGADLMRERDAEGGAYKRWDHVPYRDDDMKGKGEPSYTFERDQREQRDGKLVDPFASPQDPSASSPRTPGAGNSNMVFEMQPSLFNGRREEKKDETRVLQRSISNAGRAPRSPDYAVGSTSNGGYSAGNSGIHRSNTTGKSLADSLKRRFGSLRRRKAPEEYGVY